MTDATKRLDEIEARLKAATPGPWGYESQTGSVWCSKEFRGPGGSMIRFRTANERGELQFVNFTVQEWMREADADLIAHAPADLALLARLVRLVVEGGCDRKCECVCCGEEDRPCGPAPDGDEVAYFQCLQCRIRRELGGAR